MSGPVRRVGPWELLEERGRDEVGTTWAARDGRTGESVDLRLLPAGLARNNLVHVRFLRDAARAAAVAHPGVVAVREGGEAGGELYLASTPAEGRTLEGILEEARHGSPGGGAAPLPGEGEDPFHRIASFFEGLCGALAAVHDAGLVHGRLDPRRILVGADGAPRVRDLGLPAAGMLGELPLDRPPERATPWSAPESLDPTELVDPRADVYSLGALLYHCLALRPPFEEATTEGLAWRLRTTDPVPLRRWNRAVPRRLARVVANAMSRDRGPRYRSAADLAADLRRFLEGRRIPLRREGMVGHVVRWPVRHPALIFVVLVVVFLLEGAALLWLGEIEASSLRERITEMSREVHQGRQRLAASTATEQWLQLQRVLDPILAASEDVESDDPDLAILLAREVVERLDRREWRGPFDAERLRTRALDRLREALWNDREILRSGPTTAPAAILAPNALGDGSFAVAWADGAVRFRGPGGEDLGYSRAHTGPVRTLRAAPLAGEYCSASADGTARVWDARGREVGVFAGHGAPLTAAALDGQGGRLLTGDGDGLAHLWDRATGERVATLRGHGGAILDAAFDPRTGRVATASADGTVRLWGRDGREAAVLRGHGGPVTRVIGGPVPGGGFLTLSEDGTARTWSPAGEPLLVLPHGGVPAAATVLGDGRILTGDSGGSSRLFDGEGRVVASFTVPGLAVAAVDGRGEEGTLLAATADGIVRLWRPGEGEVDRFVGGGGGAAGACFGSTGETVHGAFADGTVRTWRRESGEFPGFPLRLPPGEKRVALCDPGQKTGYLLRSASLLRTLFVLLPGAPDGAAPPGLLRVSIGKETVERVDLDGGRPLSMAPLPEAGRYAVGGEDGVVRLLYGRGTPPGERGEAGPAVTALAVTGDGEILAGLADGEVRGWEKDGTAIPPAAGGAVPRDGGAITALAWDEPSTTLASLSADGKVHHWRLSAVPNPPPGIGTGRALLRIRTVAGPPGPLAGAVWSRTFGHPNRVLAVVARNGVWMLLDQRGLPLRRGGDLRLPEGGVKAVAPDGGGGFLVLTDSGDGRCRVWRIPRDGSGYERVATLPGHGAVLSAALGPGDQRGGRMRAATACADGSVRLFALDEEELVAISRERVPRDLGGEDYRRFPHLSLRTAPARRGK